MDYQNKDDQLIFAAIHNLGMLNLRVSHLLSGMVYQDYGMLEVDGAVILPNTMPMEFMNKLIEQFRKNNVKYKFVKLFEGNRDLLDLGIDLTEPLNEIIAKSRKAGLLDQDFGN